MAIMMLLLSGCGRIKQQDEVKTISLVNRTPVDYKTYLRKMWIVVDDEGDIQFQAYYHSGSEVFDVVVEDMNGDKLKDVEIITGFGKQDDDPLQDTVP